MAGTAYIEQRGRGVGLDVTVDMVPSAERMVGQLDMLSLELHDFREPFKLAIKKVMIPSIRTNFRVGGRPVPWEPYSPFTREITFRDLKDRAKPPVKLEVRSGRMRRRAASLKIWTITPDSAYISPASVADIPYLQVQQFGAAVVKNPWKDMKYVARPFIMFQEQDKIEIEDIFLGWLDVKLEEAGLY